MCQPDAVVIRYPGRDGRLVGPFYSEAVALRWHEDHGHNERIKLLPMQAPDPLPRFPNRVRPQGVPKFLQIPELAPGWLVVGRAEAVRLNHEVRVDRFHQGDSVIVIIDRLVGERVIVHKGDDEPTRYVAAQCTTL